MYDCEICGKQTEALYVINVEGAELSACPACSRGKHIVEAINETGNVPKFKRQKLVREEVAQEEIVEGYGEKMRRAREVLGIPLKVLGEMINEKESTLLRVEHQRMQPNMVLTAKLEKALGIKLTTREEKKDVKLSKKGEPITLGDFAEKKEGD